jgi:phosphoglycolate phosphatase
LYKLAIFDFDGTLVDSAPGIVDVMRQIGLEYELPAPVLEEWQQLIGVPLERQMQVLFPERQESFREDVLNRYRAVYNTSAIELCPPFPGLSAILERLKSSGVKVSIVTAKRKHLVERIVNYYALAKYFGLIIGAQEVVNHKPHPEAVYITAKHFSLSLDEIIVIGDSIYDLDMARNAGVASVGVTTGIHSEDILATAEPNCIVSRLDDVLPVILQGCVSVA